MAKGYLVALVDVDDPEAYKGYVAANAAAFRKYGARFLIRGGRSEALEGQPRSRVVVIEFKDFETALECYHSAEYAPAMALRKSVSMADIRVVEGYDGPQPSDG